MEENELFEKRLSCPSDPEVNRAFVDDYQAKEFKAQAELDG
jgi:hypothetical protein